MHRTEGEDFDPDVYGDASNKQGYTPGSPPTLPATRLPAEAMNAIQEEFCNLIELAGGVLATSAVADKTALWRQAYDIIFQSKKIDVNAIADNAVTNTALANLSVGTVALQGGSVTESKLASGATTFDKLASDTYIRYQIKNGTPGTLTAGLPISTFNNLTQGKFYRVTYVVYLNNGIGSWGCEIQVTDGNAASAILYSGDEKTGIDGGSMSLSGSRIFQAEQTTAGETLSLVYGGATGTSLINSHFQLEEIPMAALTAEWL